MMVLSGKPIKEVTIEDMQMLEAHIEECYVKMSNSEDATEKECLQMDIDTSKKARELIMKEFKERELNKMMTLEDIENEALARLTPKPELKLGFPSGSFGDGIFSQMERQKVLEVTDEILGKCWRNEIAQILVETDHLEVVSNYFNNLKVCRDLQLRKNVIKGILKKLGYSAGSSECATLLREIADEWDD